MKTFFVKKCELTGRFDPNYYKASREDFFRKLKSGKYMTRLKEVIRDGAYGTLPPGDCYADINPISLLRATDLMPNLSIYKNNVKKVPQKFFDNHKRCRLQKNDILIAVKGATIASKKCIAFIDEEQFNTIINGSIFRFQCRQGINPKYIANMLELNISKKQMKMNLVANNAVDYLDKPLLNNLLVHLPNLETQNMIVSKMDSAYEAKKIKEAQAQKLLDSIDEYLLGELGITLPEEKELKIEDRMFFRKISEVSCIRHDPNYHSNIKLLNKLSIRHKFKKLKDLIVGKPQYGANESAVDGNCDKDIRYIRITDIDNYGNLKDDCWMTAAKTDDRYLLKNNDLLFARSGSVGRAFLYKKDYGQAIFAGYLIRFKLNQSIILPEYLLFYTFTRLYKYWVNSIHRPAVQSNINSQEYKELPIPLPDMKLQKKLVANITAIREKAQQLRDEAINGLEKAKKEVETMILGN